MKNYLSLFPFLFIFSIVVIFFYSFFFFQKLPIPLDTIIGLYHPYRDLYSKEYPNGIPFKNFLITDPVRQQLPWRYLSIDQLKQGNIPLWNRYEMTGTPLLANFQSAVFYPLNILFFFIPFQYAWSLLVIVQPLLASMFLYLYLRYLKLAVIPCLLGSIAFAFSGFSISWMEWNTIMHTALWLPLILLAKDHLLKKISKLWIIILVIAEVSALFGGHLQIYFYLLVFSNIYLLCRIYQVTVLEKKKQLMLAMIKKYIPFLIIGGAIFLITAIQWVSTFQFISQSARVIDVVDWQTAEGWFIPFSHLVQFIIPDFFGNPTTLNYWGVWNYGEMIGYIGVIPFIFALYALFFRRDKKTLFFGMFFFLSILFSVDTIIARAPFLLNIPFISTSQPTRLLFVADFSLAILSALGFDFFLQNKKKILYPLSLVGIIFTCLWVLVFSQNSEQFETAKRNLSLPSLIVMLFSFFVFLSTINLKKVNSAVVCSLILILVTFDLMRFGWKFIPFTVEKYFYPVTNTLEFLKKQKDPYRIMSTDSRILPPNFSVVYKIETLDGYDPLYLKRYGELMASVGRNKPDISPPFGFNRIITPQNIESRLIDLLGVKYVLSISDIKSDKFKKVFVEGQTQVYENKQVFPRAFFVKNISLARNKQNAINFLFNPQIDLKNSAVIENSDIPLPKDLVLNIGKVFINNSEEEKMKITTENKGEGFLVIMDTFHPMWRVTIDGKQSEIYRTNYNYRGIIVPRGIHTIEFSAKII